MRQLTSIFLKQENLKRAIQEKIHQAVSNEKGQGMVEYGLILALISVVVILVLTGIGQNLLTKFTDVKNNLQ